MHQHALPVHVALVGLAAAEVSTRSLKNTPTSEGKPGFRMHNLFTSVTILVQSGDDGTNVVAAKRALGLS